MSGAAWVATLAGHSRVPSAWSRTEFTSVLNAAEIADRVLYGQTR
jgi:hypothetical protein